MTDNPGFYRRRVGEFVVTALNDGYLEAPSAILLGIDPAEVAPLLEAKFRGPGLRLTVNAYLVQGDGRTVLIDAGAGAAMGPTVGRALANLVAAGVQPDEVDAVLLTHFHGDHSGGLTTAAGQAVFPRAELGFAPAEAEYWFDDATAAAAPEAKRGAFTAAKAAAHPYAARLRPVQAEAFPGITRVPLPGHTPGHSGWRIGTGTDALLIWGDIMHVPDLQGPRPGVGVGYDVDPARAVQTRRDILARAADERLLIAGMHMHFPGFCHIARATEGYAPVPEAWHPEP